MSDLQLPAPTTDFRNTALVDGTGAAPHAQQIAAGSRIQFARTSTDAPPAPSGAVTVDLSRPTLLPGFIDCHVHPVVKSIGDLFSRALMTRASLASSEWANRMGRLIAEGASPLDICGAGGVSGPSDEPTDGPVPDAEIAAKLEEAAGHDGRQVATHTRGANGIKNARRGSATRIEHGCFIDDEGVDLVLERDTFAPTLSPLSAPSGPEASLIRADELDRMVEEGKQRPSAALSRVVKVARGADASIDLHERNLRELPYLLGLGVSPRPALLAGTRIATKLLGVDDRLGTLQPVKLAAPNNIEQVRQGRRLAAGTTAS